MSEITISTGNRKIKDCNIFNLPVGLTCKKGVLCASFCYSKKAERTYPGVRPSRMKNYRASKRKDFVGRMVALLTISKYKVTRIHEGGDFYSHDYIRKWYDIANLMPYHKFYAYTKRDDLFTGYWIGEKPDNLTLIYSVDGIDPISSDEIPIKALDFDKFAVITSGRSNCPSTHENGWKKACIRDCKKCIDKKTERINFKRH